MNTTTLHSTMVRCALLSSTRNVVELVDDLLTLCREHGLQLDWQAGRCRVYSPRNGWEELLDVPLRRSVFRAILARIATLCNERTPNSDSPYGGQGKLVVGADPPTVFRVRFVNTSVEQKLELVSPTESNKESA